MTRRDLVYTAAGVASGIILSAMVASCIAQSVRAETPRPAAVIPAESFEDIELDPQRTGAPRPTPEVASPSPSWPTPAPRPRLARAPSSRAGVAGTASWGCCWVGVVTRLSQGTPIRVCGPRGCWSGRSVGYGPAVYTGRIADLSRAVFASICGDPAMGLCRVTVSR